MSCVIAAGRFTWFGLLTASCAAAITVVGWSLPASAGPPFITDDPEPVELGHWEVYGFSAGAFGRGDASGLGPSLEVNYGAAPNLQLHLITGLAYDAPAGSGLRMGVSDTELGAKYRVITPGDDDWYPQVGAFPLIELPSGSAQRGLGAGYTQAFLPIWLQKDFGKWTTYGGGGYWINPGAGNRNYWFTGAVLQRQVTDKLALGGEVFYQTSSMAGRSGSTGFNLGGVYDFTEHYHLLFSAGRGGLLYAVDASAVTNPSPITSPFSGHFSLPWAWPPATSPLPSYLMGYPEVLSVALRTNAKIS